MEDLFLGGQSSIILGYRRFSVEISSSLNRLMLRNVDEGPGVETKDETLLTPGLDNTRLFFGFTADAGTRCMSLLSSSPSLY